MGTSCCHKRFLCAMFCIWVEFYMPSKYTEIHSEHKKRVRTFCFLRNNAYMALFRQKQKVRTRFFVLTMYSEYFLLNNRNNPRFYVRSILSQSCKPKDKKQALHSSDKLAEWSWIQYMRIFSPLHKYVWARSISTNQGTWTYGTGFFSFEITIVLYERSSNVLIIRQTKPRFF